MNKSLYLVHRPTAAYLIFATLALAVFCLVVTWGIELLAGVLFRFW